MYLSGVFGVDADVVVGEVAGVGFGVGFAHVQADGDGDLFALHLFPEGGRGHAFDVLAVFDQRYSVQNDFQFFRLDRHPGASDRGDNPPPVRVLPEQCSFHQQGIRQPFADLPCLLLGFGAAHFEGDELGGAFAVFHNFKRQSFAHMRQRSHKILVRLRSRFHRRVACLAVGQ